MEDDTQLSNLHVLFVHVVGRGGVSPDKLRYSLFVYFIKHSFYSNINVPSGRFSKFSTLRPKSVWTKYYVGIWVLEHYNPFNKLERLGIKEVENDQEEILDPILLLV